MACALAVLAAVFRPAAPLPPWPTATPLPTVTPTPLPVLMTLLGPCGAPASGQVCVVGLPSCATPGLAQGALCRWPIADPEEP